MFLINAPATVAAIVVTYGIYFLLRRRALAGTWGDVRSGVWTSLARFALLNLEKRRGTDDPRNWRPNFRYVPLRLPQSWGWQDPGPQTGWHAPSSKALITAGSTFTRDWKWRCSDALEP